MNRSRPPYFEQVRQENVDLWTTLEATPKMAGPWHQLFRQVQSPRHVLSELLQNADDAGATWASARIEGDRFVFEHNGRDFTADDFASLCCFGFSNKARLHTIGFRGLGFKATFSLGPRVEVLTPSIAVAFEDKRFTLPVWLPDAALTAVTRVTVRLSDNGLRGELQTQFGQWVRDAVPLVFFSNLAELRIADCVVQRSSAGLGPVPSSEWFLLGGDTTRRVLIVRSGAESLPDEAVAEIRRERDPGFDVPPVEVALVLGHDVLGRVYVVLPTETDLALPFSINAPFIQDPARTGLKDPAISPTNRCLLTRAGELAAESLKEWIGNDTLDIEDRAAGYCLLPEGPASDSSRTEVKVVSKAIADRIVGSQVLLGTDGELAAKQQVLGLPAELVGIWEDAAAIRVFGPGKSHILSPAITSHTRRALSAWGLLDELGSQGVSNRLRIADPPRPRLADLVRLWSYLEPRVRPQRWMPEWKDLRIVPVLGSDVLVAAKSAQLVSRVAERLEEVDWLLLGGLVRFIDPGWLEVIAEGEDAAGGKDAERRALDLLEYLDLRRPVSVSALLELAAKRLDAKTADVATLRGLLAIAVRAGLSLPSSFPLLTREGEVRCAAEVVLNPLSAWVDELLPACWTERTLSDQYSPALLGVEPRKWNEWLASQSQSLPSFPRPSAKAESLWGFDAANQWLDTRGYSAPRTFPLQRRRFQVQDFDFDTATWTHWKDLAGRNASAWVRITQAIAEAWQGGWESVVGATLYQEGDSRSHRVNAQAVPAIWLEKLRVLPCLPDESFVPQLPSTLLRRTPENDYLREIEKFVHVSFEGTAFERIVSLLGARSDPAGPDKLLDRIRSLARDGEPPRTALLDCYRALDRLASRVPQEDLDALTGVFASEPLVLADDGTWQTALGVFQTVLEEVPGALAIWSEAATLRLWDRVRVAKEPTLELMAAWLRTLPVGSKLSRGQSARVSRLLATQGTGRADFGRAWLSVSGEWTALSEFEWRSSDKLSLEGLFPADLRRVADVSMLPSSADAPAGLAELPVFVMQLELQDHGPGTCAEVERPQWVAALAQCLSRLPEDDDGAAEAVLVATRLARVQWWSCETLTVVPTANNRQVGPARDTNATWLGDRLMVVGGPADYYDDVVDELRCAVSKARLGRAIGACVGRDSEFVASYFSKHWALRPVGTDLHEQVERESFSPNSDGEAAAQRPAGDLDQLPAPPSTSQEESAATSAAVVDTDRLSRPGRLPSRPSGRKEDLARALAKLGFAQVGDGVFRGPDGEVREERSGLFSAVLYQAGVAVEWFWIAAGHLEEGIVVPSDVWQVMRVSPDTHWLILPDSEDAVVKVSQLQREGVVEFVASYRVRRRSAATNP